MALLSKTVGSPRKTKYIWCHYAVPWCGKPFQFLYKNSYSSFTAQWIMGHLIRKDSVIHLLPQLTSLSLFLFHLLTILNHNGLSCFIVALKTLNSDDFFAGLSTSLHGKLLQRETISDGLSTEEIFGKCWTESVLLFPEHKAYMKEINFLHMGSCCPGLPKGQVYVKWYYFPRTPFHSVRFFFLKHNLKTGLYLWYGKWSQDHIHIAPKIVPEQWLSKCSPRTAAAASPGDSLHLQIIRPLPRPLESVTLGMRLSALF